MASTTAEGVKLISITTSDGVEMKVERPVAERSILIKNLLEDLGGESEESIPIPNVCLDLPGTFQERLLTSRR
jgi:S-phase kinase-associated protein 1